jgi:DivIVA domain-containing protein
LALDRERIAKNDFPVGRRGYDPDAVDAHLAALADEVEELRSSHGFNETLAATASEQVRGIVEAAEASAAEIQRHAENEAREIRGEASSEAKAARGEARIKAREYVGKVSESTATMLERLEAMQGDLSALLESLRAGATRLNGALRELESNLEEVADAVEPRVQANRETPRPVSPEPLRPPSREVPAPVAGDRAPADAGPVDAPSIQVSSEKVHGEALADDRDDARLVALNMALNGSSREETERHLEENFELRDGGLLVDEVYATVEG